MQYPLRTKAVRRFSGLTLHPFSSDKAIQKTPGFPRESHFSFEKMEPRLLLSGVSVPLSPQSAIHATAPLNPPSGSFVFVYNPANGDLLINYNGFAGFDGKPPFIPGQTAIGSIHIKSADPINFPLNRSALSSAPNGILNYLPLDPSTPNKGEILLTVAEPPVTPDGTDLGPVLPPNLDPETLAADLELNFNYVRSRFLSGGKAGLFIASPGMDLQVYNLNSVPTNPVAGGFLTINWQDINSGTTPVPPDSQWNDHLTVINSTTGQTLVDTNIAVSGGIALGSSVGNSYSLTLPSGSDGLGSYDVTVTTDSGSKIDESNSIGNAEGNNTASIAFTSVVNGPDLVVTDLAILHLASGKEFITWSDFNSGKGSAAGIWKDHLTVQLDDATLTSIDLPYQATGNQILGPGQASSTRLYSLKLPAGTTTLSNLRATVTTDADQVLNESDGINPAFANNTATTTSILSPNLRSIDLAVTAPHPEPGKTVKVSWTDFNDGVTAAPSGWTDSVVVNDINGNTIATGTVSAAALAPQTGEARSWQFALPEGDAGAGVFSVTVTTNSSGNVPDSIASDNVATVTFTSTKSIRNTPPATSAPVVLPTPPETLLSVSSIAINDGTVQRSIVQKVTITFSQPVRLDRGAFRLFRRNSNGSGMNNGAAPTNVTRKMSIAKSIDRINWICTFKKEYASSLPDGIYDLVIHSNLVHDDSGNSLTADFAQTFHRLFGDITGQKRVDTTDLNAATLSRGARIGSANYVSGFDYNQDRRIKPDDLRQIAKRVGKVFDY